MRRRLPTLGVACTVLLVATGCGWGMMPGWWPGGTGSVLLAQTFTQTPFTATFTPTRANQSVSIWVAGDDSDSRPAFTVTDATGQVVAQVDSPSDNVSILTFTPADTGTFTLDVTETGTAAAEYGVRVTQGSMMGWGNMMSGWGMMGSGWY